MPQGPRQWILLGDVDGIFKFTHMLAWNTLLWGHLEDIDKFFFKKTLTLPAPYWDHLVV
jgi:hypothetical protein